MKHNDRDPAPDPTLRAALGQVLPQPPTEEVDWNQLRRSIADAAEQPLARRRQWTGWKKQLRGWTRPAFPLAAAATAAAALALVLLRPPVEESLPYPPFEADGPIAMEEAVEELLLTDLSDEEFSKLVAGHGEAASLLWYAVDRD